MNLKTISADLNAIKAEVGNVQQKIAEATTRRDSLLAEVQGIDAAIEGAELAHAAALAAVELNEADNTKATAAALDAARESASRKPELIQQRRTADAVIDGLTRRHADAHGHYVALIEQHKAAQIAFMEAKATQAMDAARDAIAQVTNAIAEAAATRRTLESIGGRWSLGSIEITPHHAMFNPSHAAVDLMAAALYSEIA
jgi:chromosome segregation ATPase